MISAMHSTSLSAYDQALACKEWMEQNPGATAKELAGEDRPRPEHVDAAELAVEDIPAVVKAARGGQDRPEGLVSDQPCDSLRCSRLTGNVPRRDHVCRPDRGTQP